MTKTEAVRAVLKGGKPLDIYELRDRVENRLNLVIGRQAIYTLLATMQAAGEIKVTGRGDNRRYQLK